MDAGSVALLSGIRAVVVDDNPHLCRAVAAVLECAGCEVHMAADGFAALGRSVDQRPDIIVLDAGLPGIDGYEVCAMIRQNPTLAACPVVLMAVLGTPAERDQAQAAGADGFLVRPVVREELLAIVEHLVAPEQGARAISTVHG